MPQNPPSDSGPTPALAPQKAARRRKYPFLKWVWSLSHHIAKTLEEDNPNARKQIARLLQACGQEFPKKLLKETLEIEAQGGLMLPDGSRHRTPGGVFLYLAKTQLSPELRRKVFPSQYARSGRIRWPDRDKILPRLLEAPGEVQVALAFVEGRPTAVESSEEYVRLTLTDTGTIPAIPKGVPHPSLLRDEYRVYANLEQWLTVQPTLADEGTLLAVEGFWLVDLEGEGLAIYANNLSTGQVRRRRRK